MIIRANLTKDGRHYLLMQSGLTVMIVELDCLAGTPTGEERYLPNGWTSFEVVREWLEELKYSQLLAANMRRVSNHQPGGHHHPKDLTP